MGLAALASANRFWLTPCRGQGRLPRRLSVENGLSSVASNCRCRMWHGKCLLPVCLDKMVAGILGVGSQ